MSPRQAAVLTLLVVGVVAIGLPAVTAQETVTEAQADGNAPNGTFGTQLTAFLQSNAAAANDTVEHGMWQAAFERSNESQRARLVHDRVGTLQQRLERLRERNETLRHRYENGTLSGQAYVARQSRLSAEIDGLRGAVNETERAAARSGVADARLQRLKENASELSGPQVAGVAPGLAGGPPVGAPRHGPVANDGAPGTDAPGRSGNGSVGPANGPGTGPAENASVPGNGSGRPDDAGGSDDSNRSGGGDGSGNGSDAAGAEQSGDRDNANDRGDSTGSGDDGSSDDADSSDDNNGESGSDGNDKSGDSSDSGNSDGSDGDSSDSGNGDGSDGNGGDNAGNGGDGGDNAGGGGPPSDRGR